MLPEDLTVPDEIRLQLVLFEQYGVPATQAFWEAFKTEITSQQELNSRLMGVIESIANSNPERGAELLETIQRQFFEGQKAILDSLFSGLTNVIDKVGAIGIEMNKGA